MSVRLAALDLATGALIQREAWHVEAPWQGVIELPSSSGWRLTAQADDFWAAPRSLQASDRTVALRLLPIGTLTGKVLVPESEDLPAALHLRFSAAPDAGGVIDPDVPESSSTCRIEDVRWTCRLPAALLDLRFESPGFIPRYFWGVNVRPRKAIDLGTVPLERGASIAGWVRTPGASEAAAKIALEPRNGGWLGDPRTRRRMEALTRSIDVNDRGFFQLRGVPPGGYTLTARHPELAPTRLFPIDVETGEELMLDSIDLYPPAELQVAIEPPVAPDGSRWIVSLQSREPMTSVLSSPGFSTAGPDGLWSRRDLERGPYELSVAGAGESVWVRRSVEIDSETTYLPLEIPLVPILGQITRGDEPVSATLVFGGAQGRQKIRIAADEEGEIEGYLPEEGTWPVDIVHSEDGEDFAAQALEPVKIRRRGGQKAARFTIKLPDTRLAGQVFEDGKPTEAALNLIRTGENKRREAYFFTDSDGRFELLGLSPGRVSLRAARGRKSTGWLELEIVEGAENPELELEIEDRITLAGRVRYGNSLFPGARIVALPSAVGGFSTSKEAISETDGFFEIDLPPRTAAADLIVIPPGFDLQVFRVAVSPETPPLLIDVDGSGGTLTLRSSSGAWREVLEADLLHRGARLNVRLLASLLRVSQRSERQPGELVFRGMEPGQYQLCDATASCRDAYLSPYGNVVWNLSTDTHEQTQTQLGEP